MPANAPFRSMFAALAVAVLVATPMTTQAQANTEQNVKVGPSGLPLPRFVSLKSSRVNMRIGPGLNYAVNWMYLKSGLPMEIIQEYDNWRRVRDAEGAEGWINQALLSGRRTGIAAPWFKGKEADIDLRADPRDDARLIARVEPGAIGSIKACNGDWCEMDFAGHSGWVNQSLIWGAYPGESVKD
ncbi:SH3 domain-containing protein [Nitratireductor rhodophyticola]|uniref:SH3 domain-containing protein n=1 Tax=Nitratireductor rhodophyticola TaxID=2854036 RepID=UPI0008140E1C|nr:SH3 domain-containing protein [Nitratireductor rhodophyticola]MEC9245616.1 SH3 domain-containing protein [Pseudomonadota bacterium]WPZ15045.1 SH3 domain-containing protein [Nitratireductor rhodophyticola]